LLIGFTRNSQPTWLEQESFGEVEVWKGIRNLQYGRKGLVPSRVVTIDDENGYYMLSSLMEKTLYNCSQYL